MKPSEGTKPEGFGIPDADGYPDGDRTAPLFPVVGSVDWNNPRLRRLEQTFIEQAYTLADDLGGYGADPEQLLLPREKRRARPFSVEVPPMLLDVMAALLLALPRSGERPGRRSRWSIKSVQAMIESGLSVRAATKAEAARTGYLGRRSSARRGPGALGTNKRVRNKVNSQRCGLRSIRRGAN
jgi:hypothetical protein